MFRLAHFAGFRKLVECCFPFWVFGFVVFHFLKKELTVRGFPPETREVVWSNWYTTFVTGTGCSCERVSESAMLYTVKSTRDGSQKISGCLTIETFPSLIDEVLFCGLNTAKVDLTTFIEDSHFVENCSQMQTNIIYHHKFFHQLDK